MIILIVFSIIAIVSSRVLDKTRPKGGDTPKMSFLGHITSVNKNSVILITLKLFDFGRRVLMLLKKKYICNTTITVPSFNGKRHDFTRIATLFVEWLISPEGAIGGAYYREWALNILNSVIYILNFLESTHPFEYL